MTFACGDVFTFWTIVLKYNEKHGVFCFDFEQRVFRDFWSEQNMQGFSFITILAFSGKDLFDSAKNIWGSEEMLMELCVWKLGQANRFV